MTIRLGDVALVGLPGEMFCEFGMDIKRRSPARWTLVSELCGDEIGYVPTRESFAQGGYEADARQHVLRPRLGREAGRRGGGTGAAFVCRAGRDGRE